MTKTYLLPGLLLLVAVALVVLVVVGPGVAPLTENPPAPATEGEGTSTVATSNTLADSGSSMVRSSAAPQQAAVAEPASSPAASAGEAGNYDAREAKLDEITEVSHTFSAEGLKTLAPMLQDPDPEIREAAIEGIEQLAVPEGIEVLRRAAARARNERERRRLLEAADWLALPEWTAPSKRPK